MKRVLLAGLACLLLGSCIIVDDCRPRRHRSYRSAICFEEAVAAVLLIHLFSRRCW